MDVEKKIEEISLNIIHRESQLETLLQLFGQNNHVGVSSIFLYGHTGTGKSLVTDQILQALQLPHVIIDCIECFQLRSLFEHILNTLNDTPPSEQNDFTSEIKCDSMNTFIRLLKNVIENRGLKDQTVYLVFRKCERLRDMGPNLLPALLKLQELSGSNITCILESQIIWEKFLFLTGCAEPYVVQFPEYNRDEIVDILKADCPEGYRVEFYEPYVKLIVSVFFHLCRSLMELKYLAKIHFKKFIEPIEKGDATPDDTRKLWKFVEPHLKKALQTVYLREVSSTQWERMLLENDENNSAEQGHVLHSKVELPFYSKYLLISAYLASFNPASTDKRFFSKASTKLSKRASLANMKKNPEQTSAHLLGPKNFPLDRMMAIFYAIVDGKVAPSANIFSQITSLVTLGFLAPTSASDPLENPKYKCLATLDVMTPIAKSVEFDLVHHLYDFVV